MEKFECKKCGECCRLDVKPEYWLNAELTDQQITDLEKERSKCPESQEGCAMLVFDDGLAVCLIEKLYDFAAKPIKCQQQPFGHPEVFCYEVKKKRDIDIYEEIHELKKRVEILEGQKDG